MLIGGIDELSGESNSITNPKKILENYAERNGYTNIRYYTDDGWSGASLDRPNWKKLIEDVEQGKIGTVIVKDMIRVGRDYLQVGFYTEVMFREKGVHFIAISNGVDGEIHKGQRNHKQWKCQTIESTDWNSQENTKMVTIHGLADKENPRRY